MPNFQTSLLCSCYRCCVTVVFSDILCQVFIWHNEKKRQWTSGNLLCFNCARAWGGRPRFLTCQKLIWPSNAQSHIISPHSSTKWRGKRTAISVDVGHPLMFPLIFKFCFFSPPVLFPLHISPLKTLSALSDVRSSCDDALTSSAGWAQTLCTFTSLCFVTSVCHGWHHSDTFPTNLRKGEVLLLLLHVVLSAITTGEWRLMTGILQ